MLNAKPTEDLTGRDRLITNVFFSWGAQLVFIITGFILPRMIDGKLGPELLGVWDFGWSVVAYFTFLQMGVTGSVNRFVGRYRAKGEVTKLNRVASSGTFALSIAGLVILLLTFIVTLVLPQFLGAQLKEFTKDAQGMVLALGIGLSGTTALGAFTGILTGCHRWDLHNTIQAVLQIVSTTGLIIAILCGGGVVSLAVITVSTQLLTQIARMWISFRVCDGLRLSFASVDRETVRDLYCFGAKTLLPTISKLILTSTVSVLIVAKLGPVGLALFSRPRSLIRHADAIVRRMTITLIPTTSSLQSSGDTKAIRDLVIKAVRYTVYLVLPIVSVFSIFGGVLLHLWMGPTYANDQLIAVLSIGFLIPMIQTPAADILVGLNAHGRAGFAELITAFISILGVYLALGPLEAGILGVAVAITMPLTALYLVYIPVLICSRVQMKFLTYWKSVMIRPLLHILPFILCLLSARLLFPANPVSGMVLGCGTGGAILFAIYWKYVLPLRMKDWISCLLLKRVRGVKNTV